MVRHLQRELNLSETQQEKILTLSQGHFTELRAERKKQKAVEIERREAAEQSRQDFESAVKALLNEEQQNKYEQLVKEMHPGGGKGRPPQRRHR